MESTGKRMAGKVCLITGATSGIGAATALSLAREGASVVGVGRNPKRSSAALDELKSAAPAGRHELFLADLSVQGEVRHLARRFKEKHQRLDVLINNAGARFSSRLVSVDGYEMTFALNHLSPFLLTNLLLDDLKRSGHGRIINISSGAHFDCGGIDFDNLQGERSFSGKEAYSRSKLATLLFTYELDRRLAGSGVSVNAVNPGNVLTCFASNNGLISWGRHILGSLKSGSLSGPTEGARTSVYLASSPEVEGVSGKYFYREQVVKSSESSYDINAAKRLWEISMTLTGLNQGEASPVQRGMT